MKKTIKQLFGGLLAVPVLALAFSAAGFVAPTYAQGDCEITGGLSSGVNCTNTESTPDQLTGEAGIFRTIVNVLLFIIGAIAVIMLIIGGIRYTTSNGDSAQVSAAKNTILYAIIGLIVAILAYAIVNFVISAFPGTAQ